MLLGAFTKSAQFPFHFWLPNAMSAPTPVSAYLHSATMVKLGIYLMARLDPAFNDLLFWEAMLVGTGTLTAVWAAVLALRERDLKRILARSTVSALGTLTLLIGLPSPGAALAVVAFLFAHALYKAPLFMVAGNIDHATGTRNIDHLMGLRRAMPLTATAAVLAGLSMAGLPLSFGFVAKDVIAVAKAEAEVLMLVSYATVFVNAIAVAVAGVAAVRVFWGPPEAPRGEVHEVSWRMFVPPLAIVLLGIEFDFFPALADPLLLAAARSISPQLGVVELSAAFDLDALLSATGITAVIGLLFFFTWDRLHQSPAPAAPARRPLRSGSLVRAYAAWPVARRGLAYAAPAGRPPVVLSAPDPGGAAADGGVRLVGGRQPRADPLGLAAAGLGLGGRRAADRGRRRRGAAAARSSGGADGERPGRLRLGGLVPVRRRPRSGVHPVHGGDGAGGGGGERAAALRTGAAPARAVALDECRAGRRRRHRHLPAAGASAGPAAECRTGRMVRPHQPARGAWPQRGERDHRRFPRPRYPRRNRGGGVLAAGGPAAAGRTEKEADSMTPRSSLLTQAARPLYWILLAAAVWVLLRGHNEPGGGFIGGLLAVAGSSLVALTLDVRAARRLQPLAPLPLAMSGVALALLAGLFGAAAGLPFLTHLWTEVGVSTVMLFDIGVFCTVWGALTGYIYVLLDDGEASP